MESMNRSKSPRTPQQIWIMGAGHFGQLAVTRLLNTKKQYKITWVDPDPSKLETLSHPSITPIQGDGIEFLVKNLSRETPVDWIIPCLPRHLAWEWCRGRLGKDRLVPEKLPRRLWEGLPHPMAGEDGQIYVSHADFLCPDDCPEPATTCTVTGQARKENMYALLQKFSPQGRATHVIQSHQLGPGIGGYTPGQLFDLSRAVTTDPGIIATACRCHGVLNPHGGKL